MFYKLRLEADFFNETSPTKIGNDGKVDPYVYVSKRDVFLIFFASLGTLE